MKWTLYITDLAWDQLDEIIDYVARDNPAAADRFIDAFFESISTIEMFPLSGECIDQIHLDFVHTVTRHHRYRIFYSLHADAHPRAIVIHAVRHTRRGGSPRLRGITT